MISLTKPILAKSCNSATSRIAALDGLRGIAILMVIGSHLPHSDVFPKQWAAVWEYFFNGGLGVLIFFVLSGYIITHLLLKEEAQYQKISLRAFYIRRTFRIIPLYVAFLLALLVITATTALKISTVGWISSITFTKNFWGGSWVDGHLWSLAVEEQFYLLWPYLFTRMKQLGRLVFASVLILAAPVFRVMLYASRAENGWYDYSFMTNMDALMFGCVGALVGSNSKLVEFLQLRRCRTAIPVAAVTSMYAIWMLQRHKLVGLLTVPLGTTIQSMAALLLILSVVHCRSGFLYELTNSRILVRIGLISYSAYLWQQPILASREFYGFESYPLILQFPFVAVFVLVVAWVSYYAIEQPAQRIRKYFL